MRYAERADSRASDVFVLVLATFTIVAPWWNGAEIHPTAAIVAQFFGVAIAGMALWAIARPLSLEAECITLLLGVLLVSAPFFVRCIAAERVECWLVGGTVAVLSIVSGANLNRRSG